MEIEKLKGCNKITRKERYTITKQKIKRKRKN